MRIFPTSLLIRSHELLTLVNSLIVDFGVEDLGDFEFRFALNEDQRWRRLDTVLDSVRSCGFEHRDMKNWVYSFHGVRESESEGVGSWLHDDFKRSEILFGELFRQSGGAEKLSFNEGLAPNFEVQSRSSSHVSGFLISLLGIGDVLSEFLVELV